MTDEKPAFDALHRGHVVLADDPFNSDATRPWVVVNSERHPFDGEQYVAMALTIWTWYDERVPLSEGASDTVERPRRAPSFRTRSRRSRRSWGPTSSVASVRTRSTEPSSYW